MMKLLVPVLALWTGTAAADDVSFFNGTVTVPLPAGFGVGRAFGEDTEAGVFAVELSSPSITDVWTQDGRADELPDMDRMETAFGLTFPHEACADYAQNAPVLPTRCKQSIGMSMIVIPKTVADAGAQLGNQMGLRSGDVMTLWDGQEFEEMLTTFCANDLHAHREEVARDDDSIICISNRPALAPNFLSYRLIVSPDYAAVMFAQNITAETDVIMTYGVDPFLDLVANAENIETTLLKASEDYTEANGFDATYLVDLLRSIEVRQ